MDKQTSQQIDSSIPHLTEARMAAFMPRFDRLHENTINDRAVIQSKAAYVITLLGACLALCLSQAVAQASGTFPWCYLWLQALALSLIVSAIVWRVYMPGIYHGPGNHPSQLLDPVQAEGTEIQVMAGVAKGVQDCIDGNIAICLALAGKLRFWFVLGLCSPALIAPLAAFLSRIPWIHRLPGT